MGILWQLLVQFIFRVTFGMALAMALAPPRLVTSGYYRIQLWVLMGLNTVASLALFTTPGGSEDAGGAAASPPVESSGWVLPLAVAAAVFSYLGSAFWLYEWRRAGRAVLLLVSLTGLLAAAAATQWPPVSEVTGSVPVERTLAGPDEGLVAGPDEGPVAGPVAGLAVVLEALDVLTSGLLLGTTLAAMLLGHWYLNSPTMSLVPLSRLILLMLVAVALRVVVCGTGLGLQWAAGLPQHGAIWMFLGCRWLAGLLGTGVLGVLAGQTLKVPNTQSATGILYAAVILSFIGELVSQLLSASLQYPV